MINRESKSEKIFNAANITFMFVVSLITLFPFIHILAKSLSSEHYILAKEVLAIPKGFNINAYVAVMSKESFRLSMMNSVFLATAGTAVNMLITILCAYPLSKSRRFYGQKFVMVLFIITMFFGGGIIPTYIIVKNTGLINSLWSLILPVAVNPFNLIVLKNFMSSLPDSLEESAEIDGASIWKKLFSIVVPLSKPALATLTLFYAVSHWNSYFNALMYITERDKYPLQLYLREVILSVDSILSGLEAADLPSEGVRAATLFISTLPILLVYPFIQKYFVKGIMVGAVKG